MPGPVSIPYGQIVPGDSARMTATFTEAMVLEFSRLLGDTDSFHVSEESAAKTIFHKRIVHGIHIAAYLSLLIGQQLPGFGTIYCSQEMEFLQPVYLGETVVVEVRVLEKLPKRRLRVATGVYKEDGTGVLTGEAIIKTFC